MHHFEGVVVAGSGANADLINALVDEGRAVVTMNREVAGARAPSVITDYETSARLATEHLLSLGHTRIAAIEGPPDVTSGRLHHAGFATALAAAGVPMDPALVQQGSFDWFFGRDAAEALLQLPDRPTALLVSNHEASFGVLPVLGNRGVRIPDDLSLICTEDEPFFTWWSPPLTTVDNRADDLARRAAELLLAQLRGHPAHEHSAELVEPLLVVRGSTAPPRDASGRRVS
jgi:LacI family transcriptional regulator